MKGTVLAHERRTFKVQRRAKRIAVGGDGWRTGESGRRGFGVGVTASRRVGVSAYRRLGVSAYRKCFLSGVRVSACRRVGVSAYRLSPVSCRVACLPDQERRVRLQWSRVASTLEHLQADYPYGFSALPRRYVAPTPLRRHVPPQSSPLADESCGPPFRQPPHCG